MSLNDLVEEALNPKPLKLNLLWPCRELGEREREVFLKPLLGAHLLKILEIENIEFDTQKNNEGEEVSVGFNIEEMSRLLVHVVARRLTDEQGEARLDQDQIDAIRAKDEMQQIAMKWANVPGLLGKICPILGPPGKDQEPSSCK